MPTNGIPPGQQCTVPRRTYNPPNIGASWVSQLEGCATPPSEVEPDSMAAELCLMSFECKPPRNQVEHQGCVGNIVQTPAAPQEEWSQLETLVKRVHLQTFKDKPYKETAQKSREIASPGCQLGHTCILHVKFGIVVPKLEQCPQTSKGQKGHLGVRPPTEKGTITVLKVLLDGLKHDPYPSS